MVRRFDDLDAGQGFPDDSYHSCSETHDRADGSVLRYFCQHRGHVECMVAPGYVTNKCITNVKALSVSFGQLQAISHGMRQWCWLKIFMVRLAIDTRYFAPERVRLVSASRVGPHGLVTTIFDSTSCRRVKRVYFARFPPGLGR